MSQSFYSCPRVPHTAMETYRKSIESHFLLCEKTGSSIQEEVETSICDTGAEFGCEDVTRRKCKARETRARPCAANNKYDLQLHKQGYVISVGENHQEGNIFNWNNHYSFT